MELARVLCVHEDALVLEELRGTLVSAGYEVLLASDGEKAWRMLAREAVDGVVLGYDVEALDGRSLRSQIRHIYPELPMLLFSDIHEIRNIPLHVFRAYLEHPGPPANMLASV
jgi:DNA-binding response OmpR family regulator